MFKIRTMNTISEHGTGALEKRGCIVGPEVENPDGMLIRSADLHGMEFGENLLAIARAGAGFNNTPSRSARKRASSSSTAPARMPRPSRSRRSPPSSWPPAT